MASVKFRAAELVRVNASPRVNLLIEVDMNEAQMFDALKAMLGHITDETWQRWVADLNQQHATA